MSTAVRGTPFPTGQLAEHAAVAALGGLRLEDGVVDPEVVQALINGD